ncbi:hypothetical protein GCM10011583_61260 [Streptomyces camponoticapitis]|uniref:Uncharacterized protein n=1 Tax=Streptomyces camponoticapitis TaxID=1616125 RepID=A0ABQ2EQM4_9ACTN|nr:hypothetical protein [Streptomyces camponoticapitis]GGK21069.1 hypothetical protein GCM10011583_61260 [Streptomyces camponoticapitis]
MEGDRSAAGQERIVTTASCRVAPLETAVHPSGAGSWARIELSSSSMVRRYGVVEVDAVPMGQERRRSAAWIVRAVQIRHERATVRGR